jgi:hypothetical protein
VPIQVTCPSCKSKFNAPDAAAGKKTKCPKCAGVIQIPEPVSEPAVEAEIFDAVEEPKSVFSDEDFEVDTPPLPATTGGDRKACPMCGEMIQKDAVKCRYCGEVFDPILRKKEKKLKASSAGDDDLSAGEWVVAVLCSTIGCIAGIVWMIQGKPKGKKMFLVSLGMNIFWGVVRAIVEAINAGHHQ